MSVSGYPFVVHWDEMVSKFKQGPGNFEFLYGLESDQSLRGWAELHCPPLSESRGLSQSNNHEHNGHI